MSYFRLFMVIFFLSLPFSANCKTVVLLLDGTWNESNEENADDKDIVVETNVALLRKYLQGGENDAHQLVKYFKGVGTTGNKVEVWSDGVFGTGVKQKVVDAYNYLASNYATGDYLAIFGFSRGAATARLLAQKIAAEKLGNEEGAVTINFLGLWDTVAAMGAGQSHEETRMKLELELHLVIERNRSVESETEQINDNKSLYKRAFWEYC